MSNRFLPVQDYPGLYRDKITGAIINRDDKARAAYHKNKMATAHKVEEERIKNQRLNTLEQRVDDLDKKLDKILEILTNGNS